MASPSLLQVSDRVTELLVELGLPPEGPEQGPYVFRYGSPVVMVSLFEQDACPWVRVTSVLLKDFRPNLQLVTRILRLNTEVLQGAFLLFEDDTLCFAVTLPGEDIPASHFRRALEYVARVSNETCRELQAIAGGLTVPDMLGEEAPEPVADDPGATDPVTSEAQAIEVE